MTPDALLVFPGWIAFVAAIALVLAAWVTLAAYVVERVARRFEAR